MNSGCLFTEPRGRRGQARSKLKMICEWPTLTINSLSPPRSRFGPSVKVHIRSLHLSTIPCVLVSNFWRNFWRNRELVWDIVGGKFAKQLLSGCSLIRIVSSTTPGSVSLVHGFTHDKSVPCLFSTCLDFFFGGCCEDIVRLSTETRKNLRFTLVQ